jgi:hypothetical protein
VSRCPDDAQVDAVLDREASVADATEVRAHVAACADCLARHGPRFEVELWAAELGGPRVPTAAPLPWPRRLERIAVAAALVALVWSARRIATDGGAPSSPSVATTFADDVQVLEFETSCSTTGPEGRVELRRTFGGPAAARGRVALVNEQEIRTGRDGVAVVHTRFVPLVAAARERPR